MATTTAILDDGLDEVAARAFQGLFPRLAVTAAAAGLSALVAPWRDCLAWLAVMLLIEITAVPLVRPQSQGRKAGPGRRLAYLANLTTGCLTWTALGALLWSTGTPAGAVGAVILWLSVTFFAQNNAYQSLVGFICSGVLPTLAVLAFMVWGPDPLHLPLAPTAGLTALAFTFVADGMARNRAIRRRADETQARLTESEALYRMLADKASDIIVRYDADSVIRFISPSVRQLGFTPEQMIGRRMSDFTHPEDHTRAQQRRVDILAGRPVTVEESMGTRTRTASGEWVWLQGSPTPIRDEAGKIIGALTALRDITARREAMDALAQSEARYRLLAETSRDAVFRFNLAGDILYASPGARLFGYPPEELVGRNSLELIHPDDVEAARARLISVLKATDEGETPTLNEFRVRHADGRYLWVEGNPSATRDAEGRIDGHTDSLREVTARRAMEDEVRRKSVEAEAAAVAKSEFLANMSHEIRTPLTGIIGFAGLLKGARSLDGEARTYAERISTAGETLLAVVNDILDFSKLEAGQIELDPRPIDPALFVQETIELVQPQAQAKGLELGWRAETPLPAGLMADAPRLRQVLLNLLTNAVKFTDQGGVQVTAAYDAGRLRVAVADTGVGIAPDKMDRLFQRFSQVDGSSTREHGGTGLGLAISRTLAELMGGAMGVQSRQGEGSTFWFEILAPAAALPAAVAPEALIDLDKPARILVVDDVGANRDLVRAMLGAFGHDLSEAPSGAEAIRLAAEEPFDLILMDLQMPGTDGLTAARAIRQGDGPNHATAIVALSANVLPAQVEACRAAGMDDHIAKPIDPTELLTKVARWATEASPSSQSRPAVQA
ncbi:PAS domain-containing hybrid sensor histidine kinase/response regulator [Phenylobacterium montanum]|uniref:histidine kinase n=1 Tax=Phenylobacterium montanum TaxID=2823693 RepID=A0A975FY30_9CAUL|nr:PAS domain-containing hybrid sensor histidine kinase/response regulator [Caulobacter sp. S6]QUD87545.1 PAS domain S-box protein [Caulobacter sp. S6]